MNKTLGSILLIALCSSCASTFNQPFRDIELHTNESTQLVVRGDTLSAEKGQATLLNIENDKRPLQITVLNEDSSEEITVTPYRPAHYWANFASLGIGFILDEFSKKPKTVYPKKIFLDLQSSEASYHPYLPISAELIRQKNKLSLTPTILIGDYNPGLEISYQRLIGSTYAIQLSATSLFQKDNQYSRNVTGFRAGIELKNYFQNQESTRLYSSVNLEYFQKSHLADFEVWDDNAAVNTDSNEYNDSYFESRLDVDKTYISLTPRVGIEHYLTRKLVIDGFFGLGVRYRQSQVNDLDPALSIRNDFYSRLFESTLSNIPRNTLTLNFDLNVRVGWVF